MTHLKCKDCGEQFIFSDKDKVYYKEKGFKDPKRCRACRKIKKEKMQEVEVGSEADKALGNCESCGLYTTIVASVGLCGPCCFGEAETIDGNW